MEIFNIQSGKEVGILKNSLKEPILDGRVENNRESKIKIYEKKSIRNKPKNK